MEQAKKHLKISSIIVLIFAGLTLLRLATELAFGELNSAAIPEGAPDNILLITKIFLTVIGVILLLPQVYIGIAGLRIAKTPNSSKLHIICAIILLICAALGLGEPVINIVKQGGVYDNSMTILSLLVEISVYYEYIKYANIVRKAN